MNARELADLFASGKAYVACNGEELLDDATAREADALAARATSLLAAAEANDGTTQIAKALDSMRGADKREVEYAYRDAIISVVGDLERERNGLAARVVELTPDAERYRWLRDTDTAVVSWLDEDGPHWSITGRNGNNITRDKLDAAIDAARSKP